MAYLKNIKLMNEKLNEAYAQSGIPIVETMPHHITLTTTLRCNYRCKMCYQKTFHGDLDWRVVDKIIEILPFAKVLQLFGGEPLLYKRLEELLDIACEYECSVDMISNGSLLTPELAEHIVTRRVSHIKFSIDAGTPKTYSFIRGGNFFNVLKGIAHISKSKIRHSSMFPDMHFNFLAMKSNIRELSKLAVIASDIGIAQINVFFPGLHTRDMLTECLYFHQDLSDAEMNKAQEVGRRVGVRVKLPSLFSQPAEEPGNDAKYLCRDPWKVLLVDPNGDASLCCSGPTKIGNILEQDFQDLRNNDFTKKLRTTVNTDDEPAYCKKCRVRKPSSRYLEMHIPDPGLRDLAVQMHAAPREACPASAASA